MRNQPNHSRFPLLLSTWITQLNNTWEEDLFFSRTITSSCCALWVRIERATAPLRRHAANVSAIAFVGVIAMYVLFPTVANADMELESMRLDDQTIALMIEAMQNETKTFGRLPASVDALPKRHFTIPITAYTADPAQTDDTPCITASGLDVCERNEENVVAANFLPIGTRVRIPEIYGDRVFYVEDRMNERYHYKMDVWMKEITDAKKFGVKYTTVEVF
jgi:3D (Asp-Asp-Asp) domain-containing protein